MHTTVLKDQISAAVFHGITMRSSGGDHIGVPTCVPDVAHFESAGTHPPRSPELNVGELIVIIFLYVRENIVEFIIFDLN